MKRTDPYNKLFEERIIFLGVQIDDASANDVMAQLLTLEIDPDRDILMYINSPGGSFTALTAIYDTMQYLRSGHPHVSAIGQAAIRRCRSCWSAVAPGQALGFAELTDPDPPTGDGGLRRQGPGHSRSRREEILACAP